MSRFGQVRTLFGQKPMAEEETACPHLTRRATARRQAMLGSAQEMLSTLPAPGESVHYLQTSRFDLLMVVPVLIDRFGVAQELRLATLSYNARNLAEIDRLITSRKVKRLSLLCSTFFRDHNKAIWEESIEVIRGQGHYLAAARNHAKIMTFRFADVTMVLEGSANLRTNSNVEQVCLTRDDQLHDWYARWIDEMIERHAGDGEEDKVPQ